MSDAQSPTTEPGMDRKTTDPRDPYFESARRLHRYLRESHWRSGAVCGPDSGVRFNARVGRFIKGYLSFVPWSDNYAYIQGQAYWILSNWLMFDLSGNAEFKDLALQGAEFVRGKQRPEGYWEYPNPEWKTRIATVEGCFGTLALLASFRRTGRPEFVDAARNFYQYLVEHIGFRRQSDPNMLAVNYFAHRDRNGGGVPNNSTLLLWTLAELANAAEDEHYLEFCPPMVNWLTHVQLPSGELPYALGNIPEKDRTHFLCFQYNSFEFMDLVNYHRLTGDNSVLPMNGRLAMYLSTGLTESGACRFDCNNSTPEVNYYTVALARALSQARQVGINIDASLYERSYQHAMSQQRPDGGFRFFSRFNYGVLSDRRSYPRNLSMMLYQLLCESKSQPAANSTGEVQLVGKTFNKAK